MTRIGYARVSTLDQDLEIQLARLKAEGCKVVRSEKVSGASRSGRTELATILEFLRKGDELVVTRIDRLGRDTRDVLNLIHEVEQRGGSVTVLDPHVSTTAIPSARGVHRNQIEAPPALPAWFGSPASLVACRLDADVSIGSAPSSTGASANASLATTPPGRSERATFPPRPM